MSSRLLRRRIADALLLLRMLDSIFFLPSFLLISRPHQNLRSLLLLENKSDRIETFTQYAE